MPVYVDGLMDWGWSLGPNSHMMPHPDRTDLALAELHEMAARIGLKRAWFQPGRWPHYDLTASKRRLAVVAGAVEMDTKDYIRWHRSLQHKEPT